MLGQTEVKTVNYKSIVVTFLIVFGVAYGARSTMTVGNGAPRLLPLPELPATKPGPMVMAHVAQVHGVAEIQNDDGTWVALTSGDPVHKNIGVRTGAASGMTLALVSSTSVRMEAVTQLSLVGIEPIERSSGVGLWQSSFVYRYLRLLAG